MVEAQDFFAEDEKKEDDPEAAQAPVIEDWEPTGERKGIQRL